MPVGNDTFAYKRRLPHLEKEDKTYFITFRTRGGLILQDIARTVVLETSVALHDRVCWLECMVVMPDHVHMIVVPLEISLADMMKRIKGRSAYFANRATRRAGPLWQHESFDHILRSDESVSAKMDYVCNNPVRAGLVERWEEYRWVWRACDHWPAKAGPHTAG